MKTVSLIPEEVESLPVGSILWWKGYGRDGEKWVVIASKSIDHHARFQQVARIEDGKVSGVYPTTVRAWNSASAIGYYFPPEGQELLLADGERSKVTILAEENLQQRDQAAKQESEQKEMAKKWFAENVLHPS